MEPGVAWWVGSVGADQAEGGEASGGAGSGHLRRRAATGQLRDRKRVRSLNILYRDEVRHFVLNTKRRAFLALSSRRRPVNNPLSTFL